MIWILLLIKNDMADTAWDLSQQAGKPYTCLPHTRYEKQYSDLFWCKQLCGSVGFRLKFRVCLSLIS